MSKSHRRAAPRQTMTAPATSLQSFSMAPARSPRPAERPEQSYIDAVMSGNVIPEHVLTCGADETCFDDSGGDAYDGSKHAEPLTDHVIGEEELNSP